MCPAKATSGATVLIILQVRIIAEIPPKSFYQNHKEAECKNHTSDLPTPTPRFYPFQEQYIRTSTGARYRLRCVECNSQANEEEHLPLAF